MTEEDHSQIIHLPVLQVLVHRAGHDRVVIGNLEENLGLNTT